MTLLFGKYRGKVKGNQDPMLMGRLRVTAPQALGDSDNDMSCHAREYATGGCDSTGLRGSIWIIRNKASV